MTMALRVFMISFVNVVLEAEGQRGLVPGRHVQFVLLLQLSPGLIPFCFHLS